MKIALPFANTPIADDVTWRKLARLWMGTGVIPPAQVSAPTYAAALSVFADASGFLVKIAPGEAWIDGGYFAQDAQQTLPINAPDASNPRIDRVVLRWDGPNNTADYAVLQGTPAVAPTPPALTQNQGGRWEEMLADVRVDVGATNIAAAAVADRRGFAVARGGNGGAARNLLTDGGFEVGQRFVDTPSIGANGAYTGDRWQLTIVGGTAAVTKETAITDNSAASLKLVTTASGTLACALTQKLEDAAQLRGRTIAASIRVRQSVANALALRLSDGVRTVEGLRSATTDGYVTLTATLTVAAAATAVSLAIAAAAAGTCYLDNAMLVIGPNPVDYVPLSPQEDLARCQRYYQRHLFNTRWTNAAINEWFGVQLMLPVTMGGTPTVTFPSQGFTQNLWAISINQASASQVFIMTQSNAAPPIEIINTGRVTVVEWNPA